MRFARRAVLALGLLVAACALAVPAVRGAPSSSPRSSVPVSGVVAWPSTAPTHDVIYVRRYDAQLPVIVAIDMATGRALRTMKDGAISADGDRVFWTESITGATRTTLHVTELATGADMRTLSVDGDLLARGSTGTLAGLPDGSLTPDGRRLALTHGAVKANGQWVTRFVVVDTADGAVVASTELRGEFTYSVVAFSPDGRSLVLDQLGGGETKRRVLDVASGRLVDASGDGLVSDAYRTSAVRSPDGSRLYSLDAGHPNTNCTPWDGARCVPNVTPPSIIAFDLNGRRATRLPLPAEQLSGDWERYMLWSLALTSDGGLLYAVNPGLGVVDEIDTRTMSLRRTGAITVSRGDGGGIVAAIARFFLPAAEAKRIAYAGAVLSPDGRTLYAAGQHGIAVIDTARLTSRDTWQPTWQFDALRLSSDGRFLYALDNGNAAIAIVDAHTGAVAGKITTSAVLGIVRIDAP